MTNGGYWSGRWRLSRDSTADSMTKVPKTHDTEESRARCALQRAKRSDDHPTIRTRQPLLSVSWNFRDFPSEIGPSAIESSIVRRAAASSSFVITVAVAVVKADVTSSRDNAPRYSSNQIRQSSDGDERRNWILTPKALRVCRKLRGL